MENMATFSGSRGSHGPERTRSALGFTGRHAGQFSGPGVATGRAEPTSAQFVRRVIAARNARRRFFDGDLFADPAWDILLELYALQCEQQRTSVSKLCLAAAVPTTTALRWIDKLHSIGLIERDADPLDARRIWVALSVEGSEAMKSYLLELGQAAAVS